MNFLTDENYVNEASFTTKRHNTITKLNCFTYPEIYTGKWVVEQRLTSHYIGFKLGQVTKTRKPYYFRSKKKKNVTKKNKLSY